MHHDANGIAVGCVRIVTVDVPFEKFWIVPFDVLGCNDDFDLVEDICTDWFANW